MFFRFNIFLGPGFYMSRFFCVQFFQGPGFSGSRFFRFWVQGQGPGFRSNQNKYLLPFLKKRYLLLFIWLLLKPGPRLWTRTLKSLDPEKPGSWKTWTLKNLSPEKRGPWKKWALKNLDPKKSGPWKTWQTAGCGKMIRRPPIIIY